MKKENIIGLRVLRENMDTYVSRVEKGQSFLVMRRSTPVFKMIPVDEWGDEGVWKTLDIRDKNGNGMPADKLIALIKKVNADEDREILKKARKRKTQ